MYWVRQFSDRRLQWLSEITGSGSNTYYHDDVKGRFTTTRDNNNNVVTLKMDNMKTEDSAMYYCARDTLTHSHGNLGKPKRGKEVMKPQVVIDYNNTMGGVDRADQAMTFYPAMRNSKGSTTRRFSGI
uniref:Immunoglobulin V-set domain-containing protein n=1 Tax=Pyxicephalus adspersus TaxID=30357 RepID=A0AAV3AAK1_PYXAD|nr:TPA: hypothetical protein GDO54_013567 [Pyxicephalus adspersus]